MNPRKVYILSMLLSKKEGNMYALGTMRLNHMGGYHPALPTKDIFEAQHFETKKQAEEVKKMIQWKGRIEEFWLID